MTNPSFALSQTNAWRALLDLSESNPVISDYFDEYGEYAAEAAMVSMFPVMERVWDRVPAGVQLHMILLGRPYHHLLEQFDYAVKSVALKDSEMAAAWEVINAHSRTVSLQQPLFPYGVVVEISHP
jgi:hypothetical protein